MLRVLLVTGSWIMTFDSMEGFGENIDGLLTEESEGQVIIENSSDGYYIHKEKLGGSHRKILKQEL